MNGMKCGECGEGENVVEKEEITRKKNKPVMFRGGESLLNGLRLSGLFYYHIIAVTFFTPYESGMSEGKKDEI